MLNPRRFLSGSLLVMVLSACAIASSVLVSSGCVNTSAWASDKNKLFPVSSWRLEEFSSGEELDPIDPIERITLRLDAPDLGSGFAGCNRYKGQFRFGRGNQVDIYVQNVSHQSCEADIIAQEQTYLTRLAASKEYQLDKNLNRLYLLNQQGQPLLVLERD